MKTYDEILKEYVNPNRLSEWMTKPFTIGNNVIASNGVITLVINKLLVSNYDALPVDKIVEKNTIQRILENINPDGQCIAINKAIELLPEVTPLPVEENKVCSACYGSGTVDAEFSHGGQDYEFEVDCPVCDWQSDYIITPDKHVKIGVSIFKEDVIKKIITTSKELGEEFIYVSQTEALQASIFVSSNLTFIVMPCTDPKEGTEIPVIPFA